MASTQTSDVNTFKQDLHGLGQRVETLRSDASSVVSGAADAARSGVAELRHGAQHAVDAAKGKFDDARQSAADATDSFKQLIARNPGASIGIAAGLGLLVGLLVFRPRS